MKIRLGFVSNSSSSSFCIYGTCLDMDDLRANMKKQFLSQVFPRQNDEDDDEYEDDDDYDYGDEPGYEVEEKLEKLMKFDKTLMIRWTGDEMYIGREYYTIKNGESGAMFRQKVMQSIKQIFNLKTNAFGNFTVIIDSDGYVASQD